jgi:hypothetical protein
MKINGGEFRALEELEVKLIREKMISKGLSKEEVARRVRELRGLPDDQFNGSTLGRALKEPGPGKQRRKVHHADAVVEVVLGRYEPRQDLLGMFDELWRTDQDSASDLVMMAHIFFRRAMVLIERKPDRAAPGRAKTAPDAQP